MSAPQRLLEIPPPRKDREPMKTNAYFFVQSANATLAPLFPYMGPGDIVPCIAFMRGDSGYADHFIHYNDVDEVVLCLGAGGSPIFRSGFVFVGANTHDVIGPDGANPDEFNMLVITQRQLPEGRQKEAITYQCHKCSTHLMTYEYDETLWHDDRTPGLPTIIGTAEAVYRFNASEAQRTCSKCGHVNPEFPISIWGWKTYYKHTDLARKARIAMEEASKS